MSDRSVAPIVPVAHLYHPSHSTDEVSPEAIHQPPTPRRNPGCDPANEQLQDCGPVPQHVACAAAAAALIASAPHKERRLRRRIARARSAKERNIAQHRHLRSMYTRVAAVMVAARKKRVALSPVEVVRLAERLDTRRVHQVRPLLVPKLPGGVRVAWAYDVEGRAVQEIARWQLEASATEAAWQYALGGRSCRDLMEEVRADLEGGARWLLVADIENCYPSFDAARLAAALPIPTSLARSALAGERRGAIPETAPGSRPRDYTRAEATWMADLRQCGILKSVAEWASEPRRGIPVPRPVAHGSWGTELPPATATCQGSAFAPPATSVGFGDLARLMPEGTTLRAWSDNLFVTARTRGEAERAREVLADALRRSPLGRLRFRYAVIRRRDWGTDLLGFHLRVRRTGTIFCPARYSWGRVNKWLSDAALSDVIARDRELTGMRQTARGWFSYFDVDPSVEWRLEQFMDFYQAVAEYFLGDEEPEADQAPPPRIRRRSDAFPETRGSQPRLPGPLAPRIRLRRDAFLGAAGSQIN